MVPTVPLKGWDRVAAWAGRNSRSGLCFRVALVGDDMGDCLCSGVGCGGQVGRSVGSGWGRAAGGAPAGRCPGVPGVPERSGKEGHPQRGPPVTAGSD